MPRQLVRYNAQLTMMVEEDLKRDISALSWVLGYEGKHTTLSRVLLREIVAKKIAEMTDLQRAEYESVKSNIERAVAIAKRMVESEEIPQEVQTNDEGQEHEESPTGEGPYDPLGNI